MDRHDVRVVESGHGEGFAGEALTAIGIDRCDIGQHFERDLSLQSRIACPIDLAHPARAEERHDFVWTEASAKAQGHGARLWQQALPGWTLDGSAQSPTPPDGSHA